MLENVHLEIQLLMIRIRYRHNVLIAIQWIIL